MLSLLFLSHLFILFKKSDLFIQLLNLFLIFLHESFDWSNRFKSSIEKGEITNNQTQTLSGKIYQAAKGIIDVEKGLGLPNSYTYGSILKDVINRKMSDITGIKNLK